MPAVRFRVEWPDGKNEVYYCPSTIVYDYLQLNSGYSLDQFSEKISQALDHASERVKQKFGYYCSAAQDEKKNIMLKLMQLKNDEVQGSVNVTAFY